MLNRKIFGKSGPRDKMTNKQNKNVYNYNSRTTAGALDTLMKLLYVDSC